MRRLALPFLIGCLATVTAHAADAEGKVWNETALSSPGGQLARLTLGKNLREFGFEAIRDNASPSSRSSRLAVAISGAARKDFIEAGIDASRRALIECQQETSILLVMPSLRSDSQQAHCYRF